jgi:Zn-dependent peptidase ImmA (M78 family)
MLPVEDNDASYVTTATQMSAIRITNSKDDASVQRFLIGHELGHWEHHRGLTLVCRVEGAHSAIVSERVANAYAADLLMPHYLFLPRARQHSKLTFDVVRELAEVFTTSQTATVIRLVGSDLFPAMLVCHNR